MPEKIKEKRHNGCGGDVVLADFHCSDPGNIETQCCYIFRCLKCETDFYECQGHLDAVVDAEQHGLDGGLGANACGS